MQKKTFTFSIRPYRNKHRPNYKYKIYLPEECSSKSSDFLSDGVKGRPYKLFKTKKDAEDFIAQNRPSSNAIDYKSALLPEEKRQEFVRCEDLLLKYFITDSVFDVVRNYTLFLEEMKSYRYFSLDDVKRRLVELDSERKKSYSIQLKEAYAEYLSELVLQKKSPSHIKNTRQRILRLIGSGIIDCKKPLYDEIECKKADVFFNYIFGLKNLKDRSRKKHVSAKTIQDYFISYKAFFGWCWKREYIPQNPFEKLSRPKVVSKEATIYKPEQIEILIEKAKSLNRRDILRFILIGAYLGLRHIEIGKLKFSDLDFINKQVVLSAEITKTSQRRVVKMPPIFFEYATSIFPHLFNGESMLPVIKKGFEGRLKRFMRTLPFKWIRNGLRHSCATYYLALTNNEYETARQLGHSPEVLKQNYLGLIREPSDIQRYWQIDTKSP